MRLRTHRGHICSRENDPILREGEGTCQEELSSFKIMLEAGKEIFPRRRESKRLPKGKKQKSPWIGEHALMAGDRQKEWARKDIKREEGANPF